MWRPSTQREIGVRGNEQPQELGAAYCAEAGGSPGNWALVPLTPLSSRPGNIEDTAEEQWDRVHATNLRGPFLGIRACLPHLRARGGGSVIITASLLGIVGDPDLPAYGATKGGLRAMCRSLAASLGPENIRVNTICPGDVETPLLKEFFDFQPDPPAARKQITDRYPLGRFAAPRDIANVAVFLASDDASYLSGIDIVVDGGLLARIY